MAHVLLIDDDPDLIAAQVQHAFPAPANKVDVARTGAEGVRAAAAHPDVVLLDLRLPDIPGLEVFEAIRAKDARIPVVFVTLSKTVDAAIEAMKRGAFDYLWLLDMRPIPRKWVSDWRPVWATKDSILLKKIPITEIDEEQRRETRRTASATGR